MRERNIWTQSQTLRLIWWRAEREQQKLLAAVHTQDVRTSCKCWAWAMDLRCDITDDDWSEVWRRAQSISKNVSLELTKLKTVHRYHWTPNIMWRVGLSPYSTCWKCLSNKRVIPIYVMGMCPENLWGNKGLYSTQPCTLYNRGFINITYSTS